MVREIYEVYAKVVDANGSYNTLTGYPKVFDSRSYDDDVDKTLLRASGELGTTYGAMSKRDDRQLQLALLIRAKTGDVIDKKIVGTIPDDPGRVIQET